MWFGNPQSGRWFAAASPPDRIWFGPFGGRSDVMLELESLTFALIPEVTALDRVILQNERGEITLVDGLLCLDPLFISRQQGDRWFKALHAELDWTQPTIRLFGLPRAAESAPAAAVAA